ncbi:hypothetical protein GGQ92_001768 [Gracilibacillus halotolerans]|uniref:Uncharacterized protein n=1 Tax=Gracilibacillus halotolerans TaxID=74386 RepID=A0A841RKE6_9BACI|nr:DUF5344 family protein [Gracilibacillus halotolerans]MBB6512979.1 hypothetical protein [Gracilibacillus halotolerans]
MGREVLVKPHEVEQHRDNLNGSISGIEADTKLIETELSETNLNSINKLMEILVNFEQTMTMYVEMCNKDTEKVDFVKNKLIEEDNRLADLRIFTE